MKKAATIFVAVALAAFGFAACGDDDDDEETTAAEATTEATDSGGGGGTGATVDLSAPADGSFAYDQKSADAKAGTVTINFDNPASLSHDVVLKDEKGQEVGKTDLISKSDASFTADLKPGTYTYYCDVPGHEEGGMKGTLTVK